MRNVVNWLDERLYPQFPENWDDELFRTEILKVVSRESKVLDLGAGAGVVEQMNFRGRARRVCGIDPDSRVEENPYLDEAKIGQGESIPYADGTFDVVIADNVLEHLEHPKRVFREAARTLRPGGLFLVKTPNKWHYVPTLARCTPHWFHQLINRLRGRHDTDTFPTRYVANTPRALERLAALAGFEVREILLVEARPEYLRIAWPLYLLGWVYERVVNFVPGLSRFRVVMMAVLQKPADTGDQHASKLAA